MHPVLLVVAVVLLALYLYRATPRRPPNFPPGPPNLPVYGSYWLLLLLNYRYIHLAIHKMAARYKSKVLGFYMGGTPAVVACDLESIRDVLLRPEFQGRVDSFLVRKRALGKLQGMFLVDGPLWKYQRRFALRHLRDFGFGCRSVRLESLIQSELQDILDVLGGKRQEQDVFRDGRALVPDFFCHVFLNSLWFTMCGDQYTHKVHTESHNLVHQGGFTFLRNTDGTGRALNITPWLRHLDPQEMGFKNLMAANGKLLDQLQKRIDDHMTTYSDDHMRDFTDVFIREIKMRENEPSEFTAEQLLIVLLDFLLPTLTTVNATLGFTIQCLLCHPEVQTKVQQELDTVVGRDRLPTLDDRARLPYLEATMRESMRRKTILPLGVTHRAMEDTDLCGYFVPKDTMILTSLYSYHNDPEVWGDPKAFRPERFLDDKGTLLPKDKSLPFGVGKRVCAGETFSRQIMFLIMSAVLQNFSFVGEPPDLRPVHGLVVSPKEFWVQVQPRS